MKKGKRQTKLYLNDRESSIYMLATVEFVQNPSSMQRDVWKEAIANIVRHTANFREVDLPALSSDLSFFHPFCILPEMETFCVSFYFYFSLFAPFCLKEISK